jgi:hypothetical protein
MSVAMLHLAQGVLLTIAVLLAAASMPSWSAETTLWLPTARQDVVMTPVAGGVAVNGVRMDVALAETALSFDAVEQWIRECWERGGARLERQRADSSVVLSKRSERWNDVAWIRQQADGTTRVNFSRLYLQPRSLPGPCALRWPLSVALRTVTADTTGARTWAVCAVESSHSVSRLYEALDAMWRRDGWVRGARGPSAASLPLQAERWARGQEERVVSAVPAARGSRAVVVLIGART